MSRVWRWLVDEWEWPYAGALAATVMLPLFAVLWSGEGLAFALVFLLLPVYMLHQLEEHAGERFRLYVNALFGSSRDVLDRAQIFLVNFLFVWVLFLVVLLLAYYVDLGLGLIAIYLTGFNALTHVAAAIAARSYDPGLATALALMAPLAAWAGYEVIDAARPGFGLELLAIALAVGVHAGLVAFIFGRARRIR